MCFFYEKADIIIKYNIRTFCTHWLFIPLFTLIITCPINMIALVHISAMTTIILALFSIFSICAF